MCIHCLGCMFPKWDFLNREHKNKLYWFFTPCYFSIPGKILFIEKNQSKKKITPAKNQWGVVSMKIGPKLDNAGLCRWSLPLPLSFVCTLKLKNLTKILWLFTLTLPNLTITLRGSFLRKLAPILMIPTYVGDHSRCHHHLYIYIHT